MIPLTRHPFKVWISYQGIFLLVLPLLSKGRSYNIRHMGFFPPKSLYILLIHTSISQISKSASNNRWLISIISPSFLLNCRSLESSYHSAQDTKCLCFLDSHFCVCRENPCHITYDGKILTSIEESMSGTADTIKWRRVAIFTPITKKYI